MISKTFFDFDSESCSSTIQLHMINLQLNYLDLIKGNYNKISFPVQFKQEYGTKFKDMLNTGFGSLYLISDKMKAILEQNKLTGWKTFPVEVFDKRGNKIAGYHGFSVIGKCNSTSFDKSEIIEKRLVPEGPTCKYYKGIFIEGWDGSDFFCPDEEAWIFVTESAAEKLKENKLTNVQLKSLADVEINIRHVK